MCPRFYICDQTLQRLSISLSYTHTQFLGPSHHICSVMYPGLFLPERANKREIFLVIEYIESRGFHFYLLRKANNHTSSFSGWLRSISYSLSKFLPIFFHYFFHFYIPDTCNNDERKREKRERESRLQIYQARFFWLFVYFSIK